MKKIFAFLALPLVALAALSCDKNEPKEEPVKYVLSGDAAFANNKAAVKVTADKAASEELIVNIVLEDESTLPAANLSFPQTVKIEAGKTEAVAEVELQGVDALDPGSYKAVFGARIKDVALADKVTITFSKADLNGAWSIIGLGGKWGDGDDIVMTLAPDGSWYVADILAAAGDEFKFRRDGKWDLAYGLDATAVIPLDEEFSVSTKGGNDTNLKIEKAGTYTISLNPNKAVAKAVRTGSAPMTVAELKAILATGTNDAPAAFDGKFTDIICTQVSGKNAYVEDATGGVLLYGQWVIDAHLAAGFKLTGDIAGKGYAFNGKTLEVTELTSGLDKISIEPAALPLTQLTIAQLNAEFDKYSSMRIKLTGVKNAEKDLAKGDNNISQGTDIIDLYVNQTPAISVEKGSTFDVTGIAVYYNNTQELKIWADDAIENVKAPKKETVLKRIWGKYPGDSGVGSIWTSEYASTLGDIRNNDRTMAADDKYVYAAAAGAGIKGVLAIDIKDGGTAKAVNMTGVEGGFFPTACVRTIYDPTAKKWILLVGSLAHDTDQTFNLYAYLNGIDAAPTKVVSWNSNGRRVGDFFNVVGDWSKGEIWARSNGTTHAFMWKITNGTVGEVSGTSTMGYDGAKGMGQIYKYNVDAKQTLLVTPTIGRFFSYDDSQGWLNMGQGGIDWAKSDNSAFAKLFGIKPFEFGGKKYIAYVRKLDARRSKLEIIEDKGSADTFLSTIEENTVQNRYIWARPVQNKNDNAQTDEEFRAILDAGEASIANQEMSNCSVVPVEDGVLIVAHHYRVGVVVFKLMQEVVE